MIRIYVSPHCRWMSRGKSDYWTSLAWTAKAGQFVYPHEMIVWNINLHFCLHNYTNHCIYYAIINAGDICYIDFTLRIEIFLNEE